MNKFTKKIIALSGAAMILCSGTANALAAEFIDMPNNWTTSALENAAKNKLLYGEETADGMKINPDNNITRAEMAAIIVRALGANETTDISSYVDMDKDKWYYNEFAKAVAMGAFQGDGNRLNPNNNITFQECYTVISQILKLEIHANDTTVIDKFSDSDDVASWAVSKAAAVVGSGYWDGIDGKLLPTQYITRSQFAVLIDNIADTYIDEPGTYSEFDGKNIMIRSDDVVISNADLEGSIVIGDGVLKNFTLDNSKTAGGIYARGGGKEIQILNGSYIEKAILITPELSLYIDGTSSFPLVSNTIYTCNKSNSVTFTPTLE